MKKDFLRPIEPKMAFKNYSLSAIDANFAVGLAESLSTTIPLLGCLTT